MNTAAATAYNFIPARRTSVRAPKCRKAQKVRGLRANGTYGHCIKDCVLIDLTIGAGGSLTGSGILALLGTIPF